MELLFVALGGLLVGVIAYYALPQRTAKGAALIPAVGGVLASVIWVALTWVGLAYDEPVIWLITAAATIVGTVVSCILVSRSRVRHDDERFAELSSRAV
ncbi:hypothetical protein [Naasia lichenicola]|uniref:GlsB/YeaQ/YmgE family stress response membrane protein n=1 Tax=Naasia lichenicola TaxID=2565933 RepID=A0A4S4FEE6_9MICO|nr:hypothetical protein [Naasia lichenicola]THG28493.1 hypothetical protein E6C64_16850 [Naasia lichenicola]